VDKQEKKLLLLIRIVPIFIGVVFFLAIVFIVFKDSNPVKEEAIYEIKQNYINSKKIKLKNEVEALIRNIEYKRELAETNLRKNLKHRVNEAYSIISNIYMENRDKSKEEILKAIKDAIRPIRFNQERGYFFIYSMDLTNILLPIAPHLEGRDFSTYRDVKGDFVVKNTARLAKELGSTFYTWYWVKPGDESVNYKKIGFSKYFKPLDLFVGTGEYFVDFEKNLQKEILIKIQNLRYRKDSYFFVYNNDGVTLTHIKKSLIGKNRINLQDKNGRFLIKEIIKIAQNGGGFFDYTATLKPSSGKPARKISYISGIDSWQWSVGTGEYTNDMDKEIALRKDKLKIESKKYFLKLSLIFRIAGLLLFVLLNIIIKKTEEIFLRYKKSMVEESEKNKKQILLVEHQNKLAALGEMLGNISHQWKQLEISQHSSTRFTNCLPLFQPSNKL